MILDPATTVLLLSGFVMATTGDVLTGVVVAVWAKPEKSSIMINNIDFFMTSLSLKLLMIPRHNAGFLFVDENKSESTKTI